MYEILKAFALANDWGFFYGRHDFQNLEDLDETEAAKIQLFLDPVEIEENENDTNVTESAIHSGRFMLLMSSDIDEQSYDDRYQDYIKPLIETQLKILKESIACGYEVTFNLWKTIEVINILDFNFDGIIVTFNITIDE